MLGFKKNFFVKAEKLSSIDSREVQFGGGKTDGDIEYPEKISTLTFAQMDNMYLANVWIRACVDKIVDRVSDINPLIKPLSYGKAGQPTDQTKRNMFALGELITKPNDNNESFDSSLRKKVTRDMLKYDAAAIEIVRETNLATAKKRIQIYAVPGNSIKLNVNEKGMFDKQKSYVQIDFEMKEIASWGMERIMYFMQNPRSNSVYGLSKLESLNQTVTAELYASQHNLDFFYNNATPRFAVLVEGAGTGQADAAIERFRSWWRRELQGQPHKPLLIATEEGNIKFEKVGLTNDEMQFQEYSRWLLTKIMAIYDMQPIVLGVVDVGMGKLNSNEQTKLFKRDAVRPHLKLFSEKFNNQIVFAKSGFGFNDIYLDFDLELDDKREQAEWHEIYTRNGVLTINEIRVRGLGLNPVPWGNVPYLQNNLVPFGINPKTGESAVPVTAPYSLATQTDNPPIVPTVISTKTQLLKYLEEGNGFPVGWETMDPGKRLEILDEIVKAKDKMLSKVYLFPKGNVVDAD